MNVLNRCLTWTMLAACGASFGQTFRGSVTGRITDESGKPVPSAQVALTSEETGRARELASGRDGAFSVSSLSPGEYLLAVERDGYRKHVQRLTLAVNQEIHVEVPLLRGQITEQVLVRGAAELLKTDSASVSTLIDGRLIASLPLDGRNFYELTLLSPGVLPPAQGSAGSVRGDFAINVNGAREDSNAFLLDGVYNGDPKLNGIGVTPSLEAVREFEVLGSSYDASFGRNAGGQINVVLRSGTNQIHGSAFEFFRNAALDARNHFARGRDGDPQYQRNQFGGSLGAPIKKDRTFVFGSFEGRRTREAITRITNVPTALERQGDFSRSLAPPIDLFTGAPFSGNRIPAERIHPVGAGIASLYPLPNRDAPGENFISSPSLRDRADNFDVRLDHALAPNSEFAARYSFGDRRLFDPFSGPAFALVPGFGTNIPRRSQNAMLSETQVFTPALIGEFRVAYNRVALGSFHENLGQSLNRAIGLPELSSNERDFGLSFISMPGFSPLGDEYNNPQHSVTETYQGSGQATWARGASLIKIGGEFRGLRQKAYRDVLSRGLIGFIGLSGNPLGDLLQGFPTFTGGARLDNEQNLRSRSLALFVQENWRIRPGLVLSTGLRYEYAAPPFDAHDRANVYDLAAGRLVPVGRDGVPRSGYLPDRNNFAPRVGIAWAPGRRGTVLRAGYGIHYDQSALAPGEGLYFNAPYFQSSRYFPFAGYALTLSNPFPSDYPIPVPSTALAFQRDLRTAYVQHWNAAVQRELGPRRAIEIAYVGSKGTRLLGARDINQPRPSAAPFNPRPNPFFDDINILESRGNSVYHSLQTRFQQRLTRGLATLVSYTWGRSIDDGSSFFSSAGDPSFPQDSHNTRAERGRSNFDLRQRLSLSYSYDLPFGRGPVLGGWRTNGIWTFQTGRPFTVALIPELDNSNTGRSTLGFGANDRPNVVGDPRLENPSPARWFNTGAFAVPPRGEFGNAGRNSLEGPGLQTINLSVMKELALREGFTAQVLAEAFNALNRTNYDLPDNYFLSPSFGRILSASSPRRVQFGLKLLF